LAEGWISRLRQSVIRIVRAIDDAETSIQIIIFRFDETEMGARSQAASRWRASSAVGSPPTTPVVS
jgi:hypothetical protein